MTQRSEDMLRFIGEQFGTATVSARVSVKRFGWIVGIVFFLLLLSAANTAIVAMIGLLYMMARDREMPRHFTRLNRHGVPLYRFSSRSACPVIVIDRDAKFHGARRSLRDRCRRRDHRQSRLLLVQSHVAVSIGTIAFFSASRSSFSFLVELTLAHTKPDALFFVVCVLGVGLALRAWTLKRAGFTTLTVTQQVAQMVTPDLAATMQPRLEEGQKIMVAARGITPVLSFALDEAQLRKATFCVLFVKEIAVYYGGGPAALGRARWQDDPEANAIMSLMLKLGAERDICVCRFMP